MIFEWARCFIFIGTTFNINQYFYFRAAFLEIFPMNAALKVSWSSLGASMKFENTKYRNWYFDDFRKNFPIFLLGQVEKLKASCFGFYRMRKMS